MEHIRFSQNFQFFVAVFIQVFIDLIPFIFLFVLFALFFGFVIILMFGGISSPEDYKDVPIIMQTFLQAFRTQIGDIQITQYGYWDDPIVKEMYPVQYYIAVTTFWVFWFLNIVVMQIMMLNIVIAQVGQIFDRVISRGEGQIHQELAILNFKIFQIQQILQQDSQHFDALIIQRPLLNSTEVESEKNLSTLTGRIKKSVQLLLTKTQLSIADDITRLEQTIKEDSKNMKSIADLNMKTQTDLKSSFEKLGDRLEKQLCINNNYLIQQLMLKEVKKPVEQEQ